jgi:hypothetical protein
VFGDELSEHRWVPRVAQACVVQGIHGEADLAVTQELQRFVYLARFVMRVVLLGAGLLAHPLSVRPPPA